MNTPTRRAFLASAALPIAAQSAKGKKAPVGLEMFSVRDDLRKDLMGTIRAVAKMGYQGVEFFAPYFQWTPAQAKDVRKLMDDLGIRCFSTHNSATSLSAENLPKATELNQILGSRYIIMASAGKVANLDGWKGVADRLNEASSKLKSAGLRTGFHNHQTEFKPIEGRMPMEVLAASTDKSVVLQLDVGTCLEAGVDPVAWIKKNSGRIVSMHLKEWSADPAKGYKVLFGEGAAPWKKIFDAAEKTGGIEYYLIEQEGSGYTPFESAEKCLANYRRLRG